MANPAYREWMVVARRGRKVQKKKFMDSPNPDNHGLRFDILRNNSEMVGVNEQNQPLVSRNQDSVFTGSITASREKRNLQVPVPKKNKKLRKTRLQKERLLIIPMLSP